MKAAVLRRFNTPLSVEETVKPKAGPGEALIKVMASGLCATDLHIQEGIIPTIRLPFVPGHEMAGIVEEVGPGVSTYLLGKHMVGYIDIACHKCRYCRSGRSNLCTDLIRIGFERDGSHQQYCTIPAKNVCVIDETIPFEQAAIVPDAVACMLHAVKNIGKVRPGQWVFILGVGGIGFQGVQLAKFFGAKVIAASRKEKRLDIARELGADHIVNTSREDLLQCVTKITGGNLCDVVFDLIGNENSVDLAAGICCRGGKVVLAAYTTPSFRANYQEIVIREKELLGIRGTTPEILAESIDLVAKGMITPFVYKTMPFDQINEGLEEIRQGTALGRIVALPWV